MPAALDLAGAMVHYLVSAALDEDAGSRLTPKPKPSPKPKPNPNRKPCVCIVVSGNIPAALGLTGAMVPYLVAAALDEDAGSRLRRGDEVRFQVSQPFQRIFFGNFTVIFVSFCFFIGVCPPHTDSARKYQSLIAKEQLLLTYHTVTR